MPSYKIIIPDGLNVNQRIELFEGFIKLYKLGYLKERNK